MTEKRKESKSEHSAAEEKIRVDGLEKNFRELRGEFEKLRENQERLREEQNRWFAEHEKKFVFMQETNAANASNVAHFLREMYFSLEDLKTARLVEETRRIQSD